MNKRLFHNPWLLFQDVVGPAKFYPAFLRKKFFEKQFTYKDRVVLTTFAYINGASVSLFINCLLFTKGSVVVDNVKINKVYDLYNYWNHSYKGFERRSRYFAYNLYHRKVLDLNLNTRN